MTWTALLPAWARALETRRPHPLFEDPLAERFLARYAGELGPLPDLAVATSPLWSAFAYSVAIRTTFFDAAVRRAGVPQIVVLGAGLETRAYRLGLGPEVTVFEIDRAATLAFKERVLAGERPTCRRVPLAAEVGADDLAAVLKGAGFDPAVPTAWLAEGFLFYLTPEQAGDLLDGMAALSAAPGSALIGEVIGRSYDPGDLPVELMSEEEKATWLALVAAFGRAPEVTDPAAWLAGHGWSATEVTDQIALGTALARPAPEFYTGLQNWIFSARR
ncbi:S-adenosyl-L-methionine-dependent methyltransferase [Paractinoplanes abujensis]|uniref:S-adenosyl-L-methionine-dependent methyltransferase n=1 Tax=Paractinoplanes abujensis TaxID=882441 RepID=A0A7W7G217_9ACTN|nr:SAM-dependent methyltransferase [Actinoplanes abujensis]MBB4693292.1 methyltransferase (TIGR00027 family) [Actinoplanes abujensis]GID24492.1 S-adenosyl-L-methionine-dependent methyltransferase [Actinoplanes abujensis]